MTLMTLVTFSECRLLLDQFRLSVCLLCCVHQPRAPVERVFSQGRLIVTSTRLSLAYSSSI